MDVVIGLGANLGDRKRTLVAAVAGVRALVTITRVSALYETEPIGPPQPDYLNAAIRGLYSGSPVSLLKGLLEIERSLGRERGERWGPRLIDLDILWISGIEVALPDLVVPHPRLTERRFALEPLLDVAEDAADPTSGRAYRTFLESAPVARLRRIEGPEWAGIPGLP